MDEYIANCSEERLDKSPPSLAYIAIPKMY